MPSVVPLVPHTGRPRNDAPAPLVVLTGLLVVLYAVLYGKFRKR
jgi:hypothetical protein